jgi:sugar transferase (PEP-CTERM/EpsH1 system associated)
MAHIVHVLSSLAMGGQEKMALDLVRRQVRDGRQVSVVSLAGDPGAIEPEFRAAGAETAVVARDKPGLTPSLAWRLAGWLRAHRAALVHTHNRMALIYGAPAARLAGAAVVHTKHGRNPKGGTRLLAGNVAGRLVHAFVAVSPELAAFARQRHEVGAARLSVITNGIDVERFHPDPEARRAVRAELGVDDEVFLVGTVGRVAVEKDHALLLRAVQPLLGSKLHLVIAGDGPLLGELRAQVAAAGVEAQVHLLGLRRDVPAVLNALDLFVLSSRTEGLPLVVPEAMASGLPVIATAVGGLPSVLDEGRTGFLVPPEDAERLRAQVRRVADAPDLGRAVGERARSDAHARYSAERMHREYLALYDRLLGARRR